MDPLLMVGAWAAALMAVAGLGRLAWRAFEKAVRTILRDEIQRVHRDMDDIEARFERLDLALVALEQAVSELRQIMFDHVAKR